MGDKPTVAVVKCEGCSGTKQGPHVFTILGWLCSACEYAYKKQGVIR